MKMMQFPAVAASLLLVLICAVVARGQNIGDPCEAGDVAGRPGITCQPTDEWVYQPPYIQNARKGDIVMSVGCGMVGGLLRQVRPPQKYSHTGVMTRNFVELTNSTAADERYFDSAGSDGITPDVLKFGWPGNIRQSVEHAYEGELLADPSARGYWLQPFNKDPAVCAGDVVPVYPLVIKPPVENETAVRPTLEGIADEALSIRTHYRFFGYTDATIVNHSDFRAPPTSGWASGTDGSICTELIWGAARRRRVQLEGIETESFTSYEGATVNDRALPPERARDPNLDGLYLYTEEERRLAGMWLYETVYNKVYESERVGDLGRFLADVPSDTANQITNCFAFDWCGSEPGMEFEGEPDSKDSERWRNPGRGVAISPDDMLQWDAPPTGVYGSWEYMNYRPGRFARTYRWAASEGTGDVTGFVRYRGLPSAPAVVTLAGMTARANAIGGFTFTAVPAGSYEIEASAQVGTPLGHHVESAREVVRVSPGRTTSVTLELSRGRPEPPTALRRRVTVAGTIFIRDFEFFGSDETQTHVIEPIEVLLDPITNRSHTFRIRKCTGGEVQVIVSIQVFLDSSDFSLRVAAESRLLEGESCRSTEEEDTQMSSFTVGSGSTGNISQDLSSSGGDRGRVRLTVRNSRIE